MGQVKCLRCSGVLIETTESTTFDRKGKSTGRAPKTCEIEMDDDRAFYRCPYCRAKNIIMETRGESGFPQLVIVRAE